MLNIILKWIAFAFLIIMITWIVPGISVENFRSAMFACIIIGLINTFIKPLLMFISLPINILTLGLFSFVINALLLILAGLVTPGFEVDGFGNALLGSILLSLFAGIINKLDK